MSLVVQVLIVYGALAVWAGLLAYGFRKRSFGPFFWWGIALLLALNVRYFIEGSDGSIAFFISIYDVLDNLGLGANESVEAMSTCPDNACSVWGDRYQQHPSWGVAFYDRFANGPRSRNLLLYGHILFNSITFVLVHLQLVRPGTGPKRAQHRILGRISFATLTVGTLCAVLLAAEHGTVSEYGGNLAMFGFWFMALCVFGCAVMGLTKARQSQMLAHRTWMIRFAGSMWGAFWLFRVMLFVLDPLLRNYEAAAILICIWFSAPLGIVIAEWARRHFASAERPAMKATAPAAAVGG